MTATTAAKNLQFKISFSLDSSADAVASSPNMVRKVKDLSPNFKQIADCVTIF